MEGERVRQRQRKRERRKQMERKYEHTGECGRNEEDLAPTATVTSQNGW